MYSGKSGPALPSKLHLRVAIEPPRAEYSTGEGACGDGGGEGKHPHVGRRPRQWQPPTESHVLDAPA